MVFHKETAPEGDMTEFGHLVLTACIDIDYLYEWLERPVTEEGAG